MDTREFDSNGPFKRSTRMPLDAVVRLHFEGTVAYQNGFAANVSATGMFVKHPDPPALGTRLVFEFVVGLQRRPVQGAGVVAWVREKYEGPGRPAGIGIQFTEVDARSRQHIAEALFEFLELSLGGERLDLIAASEALPTAASEPAPAAPPEPLPARGLEPVPPELLVDFAESAVEEGGPEILVPPPPASPAVTAPAVATARPTFSFAPPAPAAPEPMSPERAEEERIERLVQEALREDAVPIAGAAAARSARGGAGRWLVLAAVFALVAAGGWALWRWVLAPPPAPASPARPAVVRPTPTPRPRLPAQPAGTLAQTVGATAASETAPEPKLPPPGESPEEPVADEVVAAPATPEPTAAPTAAPAPVAVAPRATAAPLSVPPASTEVGAPRARALTDIEWTEATGVTVITLAGDGPFPAGSYSYSEIGGEKPRVLVRFKGLELPFRKPSIAVGTAAVVAVRSGWHARPGGDEQHVVIDLGGPGVRLEGFEAVGSRIVLKLAGR